MANLQNIPEDAKRLICAELHGEGSEQVRPLWQVSRSWRAVAESFVYRGLMLAVGPSAVLEQDMKKLREHAFARKYLEHGRYIYVHTIGLYEDEKAKKFTTGIQPTPSTFSLEEPMSPSFQARFGCDQNGDYESSKKFWKPFIAIVSEFKHLADIVLEINTRFPPGLVAAIEQYHPACRLHLRSFRFKSLHEKVTDPDERALATSPNLHSLSVLYVYRDSKGQDDYNEAAALRTIALAPNLVHVRMLAPRSVWSMERYDAESRPFKEWPGFVPPISDPPHKKTRLQTLAFLTGNKDEHGYTYINEPIPIFSLDELEKWEEITDISGLEAFSCSVDSESILHRLTISNTFSRLVDLTLMLEPSTDGDRSGWEPAVDAFISSLNPLRSLALSGSLHQSLFRNAVEKHGKTLRNLSLNLFVMAYYTQISPWRITASDIELLAAACSQLKMLSLTLKRSMGDRTETRRYEVLGTLQNLEYLKLDLDCSNMEWTQPEYDDFDGAMQDDPGTESDPWDLPTKEAIINCALDETLAREIYSVINSNRTENGLGTLQVETYGGTSFDNPDNIDLPIILKHLSRKYRVTRVSREYGKEDVEVVELSKEARERNDAGQRKDEKREYGLKSPQGSSWDDFRHIWPHGDDEDWRGVWKSWPLQRIEES